MLRLLTLCVFGTGCSFALMKGPPQEAASRRVEYCTSSYGLPVMTDIALAIVTTPLAIGAGYLAGEHVWSQSDSMEPAKAGATGVAVAGLAMVVPVTAIASAVWGYRTANKCSTYQTEQAALIGASR